MGIEIRDLVGTAERGVNSPKTNEKIDTKEELVFFKEQARLFGFTDEQVNKFLQEEGINVNEIMGLESSQKTTEKKELTKKEKKQAEKDQKYIENKVSDRVKALVKEGKSGEIIMETLKKEFVEEEVYADKYSDTLKKVQKLFELVVEYKADHKSTVGNITTSHNEGHAKLKKDIKDDKFKNLGIEWNGFTKDIIKSMEDAAEISRILGHTEVYKTYNDSLGERDEKGNLKNTPDFEGAIDKVKETYKDSKDSEVKKAIRVLKKQAENEATAYVQNKWMNDTKGETHKEIRTELREKNKKDDKYINKAIQNLKADRKALAPQHAVTNRMAELKENESKLTDADLAKGMQKKFLGIKIGGGKSVEEKLMDPRGLHTRRIKMSNGEYYRLGFRKEDGTLDIMKLGEGILKRVGADGVLNRNDDDYGESELKAVHDYLKFQTGEDFSKTEIKQIIRFFKVKYEHKDRSVMTILNSMLLGLPSLVVGAASGALAGLVAFAEHEALQITDIPISAGVLGESAEAFKEETIASLMDKGYKQGFDESVRKVVDELCKDNPMSDEEYDKLTDELIDLIKDGKAFDIVEDENGNSHIFILQYVSRNHRLRNVLLGVLAGLIPGFADMVARGVYTAVAGKSKNEKTCIAPSDYDITDKMYTDPILYKEYIRVNNPPAKAAWMQEMVDTCINIVKDNGNKIEWHELYQNVLREHGGFGSTINPDECKTIKYYDVENTYNRIKPPVKPIEKVPCVDCDDINGEEVEKTNTYIPPHAWDRKGGERWEAIVRAKYPCLVEDCHGDIYGPEGAIKIMQRALCTDRNGVFDRAAFRKLITEDIPAHIDFPDEIEYIYKNKPGKCKYKDDEVKRVSLKTLIKGNKYKTKRSSGRYGDGRNKYGEKTIATFSTTCNPNIIGRGDDKVKAKADYEKKLAELQKK